MDLLDNAFDAIRDKNKELENPEYTAKINVDFSGLKKKNPDKEFLRISDNGTGMSFEALKECMKVGFTAKSEKNTYLGAFGLGMKTSTTTLGNKVRIVTRDVLGGPIYSLVVDYDEMVRLENWAVGAREQATEDEAALFMNLVGEEETGTVIEITELEKSRTKLPKDQSNFFTTLSSKIGIDYCDILSRKGDLKDIWPEIEIDIKGRKGLVKPLDILYSQTPHCRFIIGSPDEYFSVIDPDSGQTVGIRLLKVDKVSAKNQKNKDDVEPLKGITKMGKILRRHGRILYRGTAHDVFKGFSTSRLSNIMLDINFEDSGYNQPPIEMNHTKNNIQIKEGMLRALRLIIKPHIKDLEKEAEASYKSKQSKNMAGKLKALERKPYNLRNLPICEDEEGKDGTCGTSRPTQTNKIKPNSIGVSTNPKKKGSKYNKYNTKVDVDGQSPATVEYEEVSWRGSPIPFDVEYSPSNQTITIQINQDHDFYPYLNSNEYNDTMIPVMTSLCFQYLAPDDEVEKHELFETWARDFVSLFRRVEEYEPTSEGEQVSEEEQLTVFEEEAA
tara:strand:- start:248 stop:1918 length:1671 start_codon:yes stop_codon:yes gene_type:complete